MSGDDKRERVNGVVNLLVAAGQAFHQETRRFMEVGLPFGPKPRLVLYHLNAESLRTQSPVIELEDSLTAFVKRTLGLDPGGAHDPDGEGPADTPLSGRLSDRHRGQ